MGAITRAFYLEHKLVMNQLLLNTVKISVV